MEIDYRLKYLKYKNKYIELKEQLGGEGNEKTKLKKEFDDLVVIRNYIYTYTDYLTEKILQIEENSPDNIDNIKILQGKDKDNIKILQGKDKDNIKILWCTNYYMNINLLLISLKMINIIIKIYEIDKNYNEFIKRQKEIRSLKRCLKELKSDINKKLEISKLYTEIIKSINIEIENFLSKYDNDYKKNMKNKKYKHLSYLENEEVYTIIEYIKNALTNL